MSMPEQEEITIGLHELTMVPEDDGVLIGRPDTGSYALFPPEGAHVLRMLDSGVPVPGVAHWYEQTCGSPLDIDDFLSVIADLGFIRAHGEGKRVIAPIRWQRLGRWTFSRPAWLCYIMLITAAVIAMAMHPALRPSYRDLFFTHYLSLIPLILVVAQIPCVLLHESFHALAGRRLGLPSKLRLGRRLYFVVAETRLDALYSVPRRQRYLPLLAGILANLVLVSALTLLAEALRSGHAVAWVSALPLAVAFTCVLGLIWQLMFYLETDLYFVVSQALHCPDLQAAARSYLRDWLRRLRGLPPAPANSGWSDRDRAMARWYAPLLVAGYGFSLASLAWAGIPTITRICSSILDRFTQPRTSVSGIADAVTFLALFTLQWGLLAYVTVRDRRAGSRDKPPDRSPEGMLT